MKKRSILNSVTVKTPCTQDWDLMYGSDEVRFCEHCVKHVHDLSAMTRESAERFVARSKGSVCVRYIRRPDGKIQTAGEKLHQIAGRASRLAAGVFGASLTLASSAYAQSFIVPLPNVRETVVQPDKQPQDTAGEKIPHSIYGTVTDQNGAVITGVKITLTDEKSGTQQTGSSNDEGYYIFSDVKEGTYKLHFESPPFMAYQIENIDLNDSAGAKYDVTLQVETTTTVIVGDMAVMVSYENQLVRAVQDNDTGRIKQLIAQGVDVNEKDGNEGISALHLAVREGKTKIVEMLLNAGARVNLRDRSRRTPMMMIADHYYGGDSEEEGEPSPAVEMFRLLIGHGAKVDLHDSEGFTALMYAARGGEPELLRLLISHRANINNQAKDGRTALMEAAYNDALENVKILLEAGADVNLKDVEGENAISLAYNEDIRQLLISYGAQQEEKQEEPQDN
jgi:hypothetical protein